MKKELDYFSQVLSAHKRPVLGIMGGAKVRLPTQPNVSIPMLA
jgi:3-phosphoglycerate kinase